MPPPNDNFADRIQLAGTSGSVPFTLAGATVEDAFGEFAQWNGHTVWFQWTPTAEMLALGTLVVRVTLEAAGELYLGVYNRQTGQADPPTSLSDMRLSGDQYSNPSGAYQATVDAALSTNREALYFQIDGQFDTLAGNLTWQVFALTPGPWTQGPDYPVDLSAGNGGYHRRSEVTSDMSITDTSLALTVGEKEPAESLSGGFANSNASDFLQTNVTASPGGTVTLDEQLNTKQVVGSNYIGEPFRPVPTDATSVRLEWETPDGLMVGTVRIYGQGFTSKSANATGTPGGRLYRLASLLTVNKARRVSDVTGNGNLLVQIPEQPPTAYEVIEAASAWFGATSAEQAAARMVLWALSEGMYTPGSAPRASGVGITDYQAAFSVSMAGTVRPPRHRFYYLTPYGDEPVVVVVPPLRQVQRDDGLGLSTRRQINRSSLQRSLRQGPRTYR